MKITKTHIIWNYIGTVINQGLSIFILPLILKSLTTSELGLWYVFGSISALVNLVDFGFSPTIMRNISYAYGGAKTLLPEGVAKNSIHGEPNFSLLSTLIKASIKIYLALSTLAGILLISIGSIYIKHLLLGNSNSYLLAWIIYAIAVYINLYYSYWSPILKGVGGIKEINKSLLVSRIIYFIIATVFLLGGFGLMGLSIAYLVSGLIMRYLAKYYFNKIVDKKCIDLNKVLSVKKILIIIWPNAKKSGIVTIGAWLITRSTTLLCSSFLGLEITAKYGLSLQVLTFVISFSTLMLNSYIPELAFLEISRDENRYKEVLSRGIVIQWITGIIGLLIIILFGDCLLELIKSKSTLLNRNILIFLSIIIFLEQNHSSFATVITLSNNVPFVKSSLLSGLAIVTLGYIVLRFTSYGLFGLIIIQGFVQLVYNNWYWPSIVLKKEQLNPLKMLRIALPVKFK